MSAYPDPEEAIVTPVTTTTGGIVVWGGTNGQSLANSNMQISGSTLSLISPAQMVLSSTSSGLVINPGAVGTFITGSIAGLPMRLSVVNSNSAAGSSALISATCGLANSTYWENIQLGNNNIWTHGIWGVLDGGDDNYHWSHLTVSPINYTPSDFMIYGPSVFTMNMATATNTGDFTINTGATSNVNSSGSNINLVGGNGPAASTSSTFGNVNIQASSLTGTGGTNSSLGPSVFVSAGNAADVGSGGNFTINLTAIGGNGGAGGTASVSDGDSPGGNVTIFSGQASSGNNSAGNIYLYLNADHGTPLSPSLIYLGGVSAQVTISQTGQLSLVNGGGIVFPTLSTGAGMSGTGTLGGAGTATITTSDATANSIPILTNTTANGILKVTTRSAGSFIVTSTLGAVDSGLGFLWILTNANT